MMKDSDLLDDGDNVNDNVNDDHSREFIPSYYTLRTITTEELRKYRKNRPFRKIYNISMALRYSSQLEEVLLYA